MTERLTAGQLSVLRIAVGLDGITKGRLPGSYWRNVDQLEKRGLLTRNGGYVYRATESGHDALGDPSAG